MNNDKQKPPPRQRAPRKRGKAKSPARGTNPARSPDAAQRNPGPAASTPQAVISATEPTAHETKTAANPSPARVLATIPMPVRWRDLDAFNHVNNSSYLTYLEEARLQWLRTVPGEWFNEHAMPVMAAVELHYRKPIEWPAEIDVLLSCGRLGTTSMTIGNRIVDRHDASTVYAEGNVVMVWVDPATGASVPLPDAIRKACNT